MPWQPDDAPRHDRKADTPHLRRLWSEVANKVLDDTGDEGRAIRIANAAVAKARGPDQTRATDSWSEGDGPARGER